MEYLFIPVEKLLCGILTEKPKLTFYFRPSLTKRTVILILYIYEYKIDLFYLILHQCTASNIKMC